MNAVRRHPPPVRRFDTLEQEAFLGLWRTYDRLRALKSEHPGKLPTLDLAARLVSRAPDITRLLDKLEQRGLIDRDRPAENRRVVRIGITAAGIALLDELHEPLRDCHVRQLGHLSRKELEEMIALLR